MTILFFGDVVGALGRQALAKVLPDLKRRHDADLVVANVENLAHGAGVTAQTLEDLSAAGVDVFTGGGHSWSNPLGVPTYDDPAWRDRIATPSNSGNADGGHADVVRTVGGKRVLILNIAGVLFMKEGGVSPFRALDDLLANHADKKPDAVIVDFHAEATAEKEAFGHHADGRVAAVIGTHTHVQTSDAKILPGGTAYLTDVGRCGSYDSVIGFEKRTALARFLAGKHGKYDLERSGKAEVDYAVLRLDPDTGKALGLDAFRDVVDA
ncbi:YmdB family metallophosphoesterase [Candidatus Uhrbacteria bacterium]|nr:YmdB family metallophosphoesterase [Candidatus Uhrbacteria bacterium]